MKFDKVYLYIIFSIIMIIFILFSISENLFVSSYEAYENKLISTDIDVVNRYVLEYEKQLNRTNLGWAAWDDTYKFIDDLNDSYIKDNMSLLSYQILDVNYVIYLNKNNKIVYYKGFDLLQRKEIFLDKEFLKKINNNYQKVVSSRWDEEKFGFITLGKKIYYISCLKILKSNFTGPSNGTIIMMKEIDNSELLKMSELLNLKLSMKVLDKSFEEEISNLKTKKTDTKIIKYIADNEKIKTYYKLNDIFNTETIYFTITSERNFYKMSLENRIIYLITIIILIVIFTLLLVYILYKNVFVFLKQQSALFNTATAMIYYKDKNLNYVTANKYCCDYIGISAKELKGKNDYDIYPEDEAYKIRNSDLEIKNLKKSVINLESSFITKDGETKWYTTNKTPILNSRGGFEGIVGITSDITDIKEKDFKLAFAEFYDNITMTTNRKYFIKTAQEYILSSEIKCNNYIIYIGINKFKLINEILGYATGNEFLRIISQRLIELLRPDDFVSRAGGDEFAILVKNSDISEIESYCKSIIKNLSREFRHNENLYYISSSIGISSFSDSIINVEEVIKHAYTALHEAKLIGDNNYLFYSDSFDEKLSQEMDLRNQLTKAVLNKEFALYYQTQIDTDTMEINSVEALIRWIHPEKGIISPAVFIDIAEESDLILKIGEWIIEEACWQLQIWKEQNIFLKTSINISGKQFCQDNFVDILKENINKYNIDAKYLKLEITESIIVENSEKLLEKLKKIKELGIELYIDDFGTGYSSLNYLKKFPIDAIKIDRSFITNIDKSDNGKSIVKTLITLAKELDLKTIAEGVETKEEYLILKELGCSMIQGFYFSKAVPPENLKLKI